MGVLQTFLDLIFPPRCVFCRKLLGRGENSYCAGCAQNLPYTEKGGAQTGEHFTICVSPLYYDGVVRDSIHRFKFKDASGYAKGYAQLIADCIRENLGERGERYDFISWVPLSADRLKSRGYDQAMLLAMATALCLDDVAVETLRKHTDVPAQSGVGDREKRRENISGVYEARDPELIADKRILLIDDIVTTGSTLSECALTLLRAGASEVLCATLARTED